MSANRHIPYLIVLFEDQAYKDLFSGFLQYGNVNGRQINERPLCRGWGKVKDELTSIDSLALKELDKYPKALVLALIDGDDEPERINEIKNEIPQEYRARIFIISSLKEAEDIVRAFGSGRKEGIGLSLAQDCAENDCQKWKNESMLAHNQIEINALKQAFPLFIN